MSRPLTDDDFQEMMSYSQVPGSGWLGASYAIFNQLERVEKEEKEKEQKEQVIDLEEEKANNDMDKEKEKKAVEKEKEKVPESQFARDRSRSPRQNASDVKVATGSQ